MSLAESYPEVSPDICFTTAGYKGEADFSNVYLGWDRTLAILPTITLQAIFKTDVECEEFMNWWKSELDRGVDTFLIQTRIFGRDGLYGLRQITPLSHTVDPNKISFKAEVVFDSDSIDNSPPNTNSYEVNVEVDSTDNFIELIGDDLDNDELAYEIVTDVSSETGTLTGTPPLMRYTPQPSFKGTDSFTFKCNDRWADSSISTVTINVGEQVVSEFSVKYTLTAPVRITGNFHYDNGSGLIQRGTGGYVDPYYNATSFLDRASTASYITSGVMYYAAIDEARFENGVALVEGESTNYATHSQTFTDVSYSLYGVGTLTHGQSHIDASIDAVKFTSSTVLEYQLMRKTLPAGTIPYSSEYAVSVIVEKSGNYDFFVLDTDHGDTYGTAIFNIETGIVTQVITQYGTNGLSATIVELGNNRYKCSLYGLKTDNELKEYYINMTSMNSDTITSIKGDGVSGFILHTLQVEVGAESTSYIPTTTTSVTRAEDIANLNLTIYSDDHIVDERDSSFITETIIENWGQRKSFVDFYKNMSNISNISYSNNAGTCVGTNFSGMFWGAKALSNILPFETGYGTDFTDMFRETELLATPNLDYSMGIYFQRMFMDTLVKTVRYINSGKGQYFQEMFSGASQLYCMDGIDTLNKINTTDMFRATSMLNAPDANDVTNIKAGFLWVNPSDCALEITSITENSSPSCIISSMGGSCTTTTNYTVNYVNADAAPSFVWSSSNGSITAGQGTATATIEQTGDETSPLYVECSVDDSANPQSSGIYTFTQTRTLDPAIFLELTIPKQYSELNLRDYIDSKNSGGVTQVVLYNTIVNCSMITGDLTGLNVTFFNSGEIQGFSAGLVNASLSKHDGLTITSAMKLVNTGIIRASGGYGGRGGNGADDQYSYYTYESRYQVDCYGNHGIAFFVPASQGGGTDFTRLFWDGKYRDLVGDDSDWHTIPGLSHEYRKTTYKSMVQCSYYSKTYTIERRVSTVTNRIGGTGGLGGNGSGYGESFIITDAWRNGSYGSASIPTGGNSGGKGGAGGYWGHTGNTGIRGDGSGDYGIAGGSGGKAITGSSLLLAGSTTGSVSGSVT